MKCSVIIAIPLQSDPAQLESISHVAKEAAERTVRRLGARRLPTMKAPVIFAAEEARGLLGHFSVSDCWR